VALRHRMREYGDSVANCKPGQLSPGRRLPPLQRLPQRLPASDDVILRPEAADQDRAEEVAAVEDQRLLKQLLSWRIGALPPWVENQLAGARPERLEAWAKRVLDAQTLDAVFVERS